MALQKPGVDQLCGHCADGVLAVAADGSVWPCPLSRWMTVGNVRHASLAEVNRGAGVVRAELTATFKAQVDEPCDPKCDPCQPNKTDGDPGGCDPDYKDCGPWKKK